jgi:hypothetical protein
MQPSKSTIKTSLNYIPLNRSSHSVLIMSVFDVRQSLKAPGALVPLHYRITVKKIKMKKLVFTIQMFVLVALFPVYLVAELNHEAGKLPLNHSSSAVSEKAAAIQIQPANRNAGTGLKAIKKMDVK